MLKEDQININQLEINWGWKQKVASDSQFWHLSMAEVEPSAKKEVSGISIIALQQFPRMSKGA